MTIKPGEIYKTAAPYNARIWTINPKYDALDCVQGAVNTPDMWQLHNYPSGTCFTVLNVYPNWPRPSDTLAYNPETVHEFGDTFCRVLAPENKICWTFAKDLLKLKRLV